MFRDHQSRQSQSARIGRFSDGIEQIPRSEASMRIGRFSDGIERLPRSAASDRVGTFADGVAQNTGAPANARVGSFADGYLGARPAASRSGSRHLAALASTAVRIATQHD